jgi:hypothetical protein
MIGYWRFLTGLSSCPPQRPGAAYFGATVRSGGKDLPKHTTVYGCRIESREEAGDDSTTHTSPLAVPAGPEPHILVRPPGAAGNDPSRHTTVYGCRIEGREEEGMMIETSLKKKITRSQKREKNKKNIKTTRKKRVTNRRSRERG